MIEQTYTDCNTLEGRAVGLIDGIMAMTDTLYEMNLESPAIKAALNDLYERPSFQSIILGKTP